MNYDKSGLTCSPSASSGFINEIQNIFSVAVVNGHDLYLGLPTFTLRSKHINLLD